MRDVSVLEIWTKKRAAAEKAAPKAGMNKVAALGQPPKRKMEEKVAFSRVTASDQDAVARKMFVEAKNVVDKMLGGGVAVTEKEFKVFANENLQKGVARVKEAKASYDVGIRTPWGAEKKAQVIVSYDAAKPEPIKVEDLFYDESDNERPLSSLELNKYAQETSRTPNNSSLVFFDVEGPEVSAPHAPAPVQGYSEIEAADLPATVAALRAKGFEVKQNYIGREHGNKFGKHCFEIVSDPSRYAEMKEVVASINERAQRGMSTEEWFDRSLEKGKSPKYDKLPFEDRSLDKADAKKDFDKPDWPDRAVEKGGESVASKIYKDKSKWMRYDQKGMPAKTVEAEASEESEESKEEEVPASPGQAKVAELKEKVEAQTQYGENSAEKERAKTVHKDGKYDQGEMYGLRSRTKEAISPEDYKGEKVDSDAIPKGVETRKDGLQMGSTYEIRERKREEISPEDYKGEKVDNDAVPKGVDTHKDGFEFGEMYSLREKGREKPTDISPETGHKKAAQLKAIKERIAKLREKVASAK
jgi:hypothetical protein